ncbi:hypothetical protein BGZ91_001975 [Linnemannia elongata]|nr:hypothetical protein BGZ91_001975 [Linnemannia elongata]
MEEYDRGLESDLEEKPEPIKLEPPLKREECQLKPPKRDISYYSDQIMSLEEL